MAHHQEKGMAGTEAVEGFSSILTDRTGNSGQSSAF